MSDFLLKFGPTLPYPAKYTRGQNSKSEGSLIKVGGENSHGELGLNPSENSSPSPLVDLLFFKENSIQIRHISCGGNHCICLTNDGDIYTWGLNQESQCGRSGPEEFFMPTKLDLFGLKYKSVAAGKSHSLCVSENGELVSFGDNTWGQCGDGNGKEPIKVSGLKEIVGVAGGERHSVVFDERGRVIAFGCNESYQVGAEEKMPKVAPTLLEGLENVIQISCGREHSLARTKEGKVYSWGSNSSHQSGAPIPQNESFVKKPTLIKLDKVCHVSGGSNNSMAVTEDGKLYFWGMGILSHHPKLHASHTPSHSPEPQLVDFLPEKKFKYCSVGSSQSFVVTEDQYVYGWGPHLGMNVQQEMVQNMTRVSTSLFSNFWVIFNPIKPQP